MEIFKIVAVLIGLCALLGYINSRFLKLPHIIGLLILSLCTSIAFWAGATIFHWGIIQHLLDDIQQVDFSKVLLNVMLCFMLFAGAFHTNAAAILKEIRSITILAFFGTILSTVLIGGFLFFLSGFLRIEISLIYCMLFGALISPTDPIAVLGIISKAKIQERIKTNIIGESLFNDGIGIVIFITISMMIEQGGEAVTFGSTLKLFAQEALGGLALGVAIGYLAYILLKSIDDYQTEIMITLALVMGGYFIADFLHISGPLAMVVAGLIIGGERIRKEAMSTTTHIYMDKFWELVDIGLNSILFLLIGLRLTTLSFSWEMLVLSGLMIILVLLSRALTVGALSNIFKKQIKASSREQRVLVWSGLRGGLSLAMALSIQAPAMNGILVFITYSIVLFSIIIQGLTVEKVANIAE